MDWSKVIGKQISVLIVGKGEKIENYLGVVAEVEGDYLTLNLNNPNPNFTIDKIIFSTELIKSMWVYKEGTIYTPSGPV